MRIGMLPSFLVNSLPSGQQISHCISGAIDSVADLARDRKLNGPDQSVTLEQLPEIGKIWKRRPPKRALPQPMADSSTQRTLDRDHAHGLAGQNGLGQHRNAVRGDVTLVALGKEHAEAQPVFDHHLLFTAHHALEQSPAPAGRARAGRNDDAALRIFPAKPLDGIDQCGIVELPVTRRSTDRNQSTRVPEFAEPLDLVAPGLSRLRRVSDRKRQFDQVASRSRILRRGDLQIEIKDPDPRIADMDQLRLPTALRSDVPRDPNARITGNDDQIGPGRANEAAGLARNNQEAPPIEKRNSPQRVIAHLLDHKRKAERIGKRQQLIVVADPIVEH